MSFHLCNLVILSDISFVSIRGASTLTRAGHARLTSAQFPTILDRHGNPPIAVDPTVVRKYDLQFEQSDIRHCNEIVLQFLALSG